MQTAYLKLLTTDDIPQFMVLARNFHEASPYRHTEFSETKVKDLSTTIVKADKNESIIIGLFTDRLVGFIMCGYAESTFGNDKMGVELAWWVEEEYRGTRKSLELLLAFKDWAKRIGCSYIQTGSLEGLHPEKLEKVYNKMGMYKVESSFIGVL